MGHCEEKRGGGIPLFSVNPSPVGFKFCVFFFFFIVNREKIEMSGARRSGRGGGGV